MEPSFLAWVCPPAAALLVFVLPGAALLAWRPSPDRDFLEWLALAVGLSISGNALVALGLFVLHQPVGRWGLVLLFGSFSVLGLAGLIWNRRRPAWGTIPWLSLAVFAVLIAWRFYQVRGLAFPPWVDAPQHVLIVRRMLEVGGLPTDLGPHLPVPFFYHFGYHATTALFAALSGVPLEKAALWTGQGFNALISLSVYYLGQKIWKDPGRSGLAALLVAFVSQMPAYYATWGRYSLLSGLVVLPLAMGTAWESYRLGGNPSSRGLQAVLAAGTFLTHYFAAGLLALFYLLLLAQGSWRAWTRKGTFRELVLGPLTGYGAAWALTLPWLLWIGPAVLRYGAVRFTAPGQSLDGAYFSHYGSYLVYLLGPSRNYLLILLAALGLIGALRDPRIRVPALWSGLLGWGVIPWGFRLSPFRPDHLAIVLFLPVCLLASHTLWEVFNRYQRKKPSVLTRTLARLLLFILLIWGIKETRDIIKPETILAGWDDLQAIRWIDRNTPASARFLINAAPWEWGRYRGVDGGGWILPLTGRWVSLPPVFYGFGSPDFIDAINRLAAETLKMDRCGASFRDLVRRQGITHVYSRRGAGPISPEFLEGCPELERVYRGGPVYVFKIP